MNNKAGLQKHLISPARCLIVFSVFFIFQSAYPSQQLRSLPGNGSSCLINATQEKSGTLVSDEDSTVTVYTERQMENLKKNLSITLSSTNPYSFSSHNSKIYFVVTNIMNDESFTYLKMYLVNKSTSRYTFGDIIITQVENPLGGKKSGSILHSKFIEPVEVKLPVDSEVNARAKQAIVIAIPLYTGTDNGKLIIQMFEKNGSRNGKIELKGKDITKATLIRN